MTNPTQVPKQTEVVEEVVVNKEPSYLDIRKQQQAIQKNITKEQQEKA